MDSLEGVLGPRHRVASFLLDGDKIEIQMEPDYFQEYQGYKGGCK